MNTFFYRHNDSALPPIINEEKVAFNELTFVIKGQLDYIVNGRLYEVKNGDAIYIKSGSIRQRISTNLCNYVSFNFYYEIDADLTIAIKDCISDEMLLLFSTCDKIYSKYNDWFDKVDLLRNTAIKLILSNIKSKNETPVITQIVNYIRNNLTKKITLNELAKEVRYSPNYLDYLFNKNMGISIINYIIRERINLAKRLIDEDILSLHKVSESVGIENYNYFCRLFKKLCNQTPGQYKNLIHKNQLKK